MVNKKCKIKVKEEGNQLQDKIGEINIECKWFERFKGFVQEVQEVSF